ncbi:helix-turn-helix domain-containing protein [Lactobacillus ultunensis]|uniref:helix-turn-helix domain-containing protein n=1 Tax=Lactobacillus ultunensis TaxID=227945 RepID=UPI0019132DF6|nr:helix-turn-helix domain-containing protein [Lactobacillus ultunensis]QQP29460.1 helix-turn-helix domain-containing protein [Lactobacillus ultunensis]
MKIGDLLKEYRLKQNKSQHDFIGTIVTQSYYSKVEKNTSQISVKHLIDLLHHNEIPVQEFFNKFDQKNDVSYYQKREIDDMVTRAYYANNIKQMKSIKKVIHESKLSKYEQNNQLLMVDGFLALMNPDLNSQKLISMIKNKIFDIPSYTQDKLTLYCDFMRFYNLEDNEIITRNILRQYQKSTNTDIQELILAIICNILILSIESNKFENTAYFIDQIESIKTTPQLLFYKLDIEFFKSIIEMKRGINGENGSSCQEIIKILKKTGMQEYSKELEKFIEMNK